MTGKEAKTPELNPQPQGHMGSIPSSAQLCSPRTPHPPPPQDVPRKADTARPSCPADRKQPSDAHVDLCFLRAGQVRSAGPPADPTSGDLVPGWKVGARSDL